MRRAIVMTLLAVTGESGAADWVKFGGEEGVTFYSDPSTIQRAGDVAQGMFLVDWNTPQDWAVGTPAKKFLSSTVLLEFKCKEGSYRKLSEIARSGNMNTGAEVSNESYKDASWEDVKPDSPEQRVLKIACGTK